MADSPAILCGLGNPGRRYRMTRHNLGFLVVERFVERNGGAPFQSKFNAEYADVRAGGRRVLAVCPQTYMNLSGDSLVQFANYFKVARADGKFTVTEAWSHKAQGYMSTPVVINGVAYEHLKSQRMMAIEMETGRELWTASEGFGKYVSLVAQGDRLLALDQRGWLY